MPISSSGLWYTLAHGTCCNARAREDSWLIRLDLEAGYARWIPDHPNWMPVTGLIRAASVWSRFDWIGRGWSEGSPRNINPLSPHRLCYSLFNRLRLVEAAIPAASLLRWNMFRALLGILARMERLPTDLMVYRPFPEGGRERDCRWFAFCSMKRLMVARREERSVCINFNLSRFFFSFDFRCIFLVLNYSCKV